MDQLTGKLNQLGGIVDQIIGAVNQAEAQTVTELKLQALIDSLNQGRNGHA